MRATCSYTHHASFLDLIGDGCPRGPGLQPPTSTRFLLVVPALVVCPIGGALRLLPSSECPETEVTRYQSPFDRWDEPVRKTNPRGKIRRTNAHQVESINPKHPKRRFSGPTGITVCRFLRTPRTRFKSNQRSLGPPY